MKALKPYFLRACYDWIVDNGWTPHLLVDGLSQAAQLPPDQRTAELVLNVGPMATVNFQISDDGVSFGARFAGTAHEVRLPLDCVRAMFAKENGKGMAFGDAPGPVILGPPGEEPPDGDAPEEPPPAGPAGKLRLVK